MAAENKDNKADVAEHTVEILLAEYQGAQSSAEHHDQLAWNVTGTLWIASVLLLGFVLDGLRDATTIVRVVLIALSAFGIGLTSAVWWTAGKLRDVKRAKYGRCREIEAKLGMLQHSALKYSGGQQFTVFRVLMAAMIVVWLIVLYLLLCPCTLGAHV